VTVSSETKCWPWGSQSTRCFKWEAPQGRFH